MFIDPDPAPFALDAPPTWEDALVARLRIVAVVLAVACIAAVSIAAWLVR